MGRSTARYLLIVLYALEFVWAFVLGQITEQTLANLSPLGLVRARPDHDWTCGLATAGPGGPIRCCSCQVSPGHGLGRGRRSFRLFGIVRSSTVRYLAAGAEYSVGR